MSQAKFTLIGFYYHMKAIESDLFMNLDLPADIDKETVINNILIRGGEFEVLYSNPFFLRDSITTWSKKWYWTFDKWIKAINIEYEPLNNYDRHEEWTDAGTDNRIVQNTVNTDNSSTVNGTENVSTENHITDSTSGTNSDNSEHLISAFNETTYSPKDKAITTGSTNSSGQNDSTGSVNGSNTSTTTDSTETTNDTTDDLTTNKSHNGRMWGNIGVTTSQQMLQSEIDIAMFNLYDKIADIFLQEYVLPIY